MRLRVVLTFIICYASTSVWSQQNYLPLGSFYKDKLFAPYNSKAFSSGSFLPISESQFDLNAKIADSSRQYYEFSAYLFKKNLIELKGEDYFLTISPTMDVSVGQDHGEKIPSKKFQNTRGFIVEGDLMKNVSFSTSFYENQARFVDYEKNYYQLVGEMYPNGSNYYSQNAVIPGGGRTKPFKTNGFDYAYAFGSVVYAPSKRIQISGGNNSHFVGSGYRSLLLSDNSIYAPYIQTNIKLTSKWTYVYMRAKLMNLMRRPLTTSDEAYYEPKALSVNYLTYQASDKLAISLFEGMIWSKGDSVTSTHVNPLFYNPVPLVSELVLTNQQKMSALIGLNSEYLFNCKNRVYSQVAISNFDTKNIGFQLGYRGYDFLRSKNLMLQMEYNYVPRGLYASTNRRLDYSHYNLPLAHTKGSGFQEFVLRFNYEYQRFYMDVKIISYHLDGFQNGSLLAVNKYQPKQYGNLQDQQFEVGYRFNRKINLTLFASYMYRNDFSNNTPATKFVNAGIRTGLVNHYNDF